VPAECFAERLSVACRPIVLPAAQTGPHNKTVTDYQAQAICPQCGSAAAVHSIQELAALVQGRMGGMPPGYGGQPGPGPAQGWEHQPPPGPPPGPQPGWVGEPQAGPPQPGPPPRRIGETPGAPPPGWVGEPQAGPPPGPQPGWVGEPQAGPPPGGPQPGWVGDPQAGPPPGGPQPGWVGEPQAGPPGGAVPGWARRPRSGPPGGAGGLADLVWSMRRPGGGDLDDQIADAAIGAATRFIGRRLGKKMQQAYTERVQPAMAAKREEMVRETTAIAERHPGLRACLNDNVAFLAGGSRTVPLDKFTGPLTAERADALVAQLSEG